MDGFVYKIYGSNPTIGADARMGAIKAKTFKNTGLLQVPKAPWNASRNCNLDNTPANMQMKFESQKHGRFADQQFHQDRIDGNFPQQRERLAASNLQLDRRVPDRGAGQHYRLCLHLRRG